MNDLLIPLRFPSKLPVYEQIYQYIREEIKSGRLPCHGRLPSVRALARHMQISRSTVDMAYGQLVAEGYVEALPRRGYYVADIEGVYTIKPDVFKAQEDKIKPEYYPYDFTPRGIDLENFPYNTWRKITKNVLSADNKELFGSGSPKGDERLRRAICNYLHQARGVRSVPEQLLIGAGNEYLLFLLHQLVGATARIGMENPTYMQAYRVLKSLGHSIVPILMDKNGPVVEEIEKSGVNLVYVMPSHQYPLGIVMPLKRRLELLAWAKREDGRYIIEDDYDSQFRYKGKPIPSLQGMDTDGKVIYLGTFSKSIAPAIRVSYMVLPPSLRVIYEKGYGFYSSTVSRIDQTILDIFLREGYFERHLNRMRSIYRNKHDTLLNALKSFSGFTISGENAGIHLLLTAEMEAEEKGLIEYAAKNGVRVYGLSEYYIAEEGAKRNATVILGYANMKENDIIEGVSRLKEAWKPFWGF